MLLCQCWKTTALLSTKLAAADGAADCDAGGEHLSLRFVEQSARILRQALPSFERQQEVVGSQKQDVWSIGQTGEPAGNVH